MSATSPINLNIRETRNTIMRRETDKISRRIVKILQKADQPLETREIELILKDVTRVKVLYRLNYIRGEGLINGKPVGSGKGAWIWWRKGAFK